MFTMLKSAGFTVPGVHDGHAPSASTLSASSGSEIAKAPACQDPLQAVMKRKEMEDVEVFGETTRTCVEANETQDADGTIGNTRQPSVSTKKSKFVTRLHVEQSLTSVGAIVDGSAFRPLKSNKGDRVCCFKYRCNLQFTATEAQAIRDEVPAVGKQGCRALRKAYVQQWTADDPGGSHKLMLGPRKQEVCVAFFNILTGISKDLIYAARKLEDPAPMTRLAGSVSDAIVVWLRSLAGRWETYPGNLNTYMVFPSKKFVYEQFCYSGWWKTGGRDDPPTYETFVAVWNRHCGRIKLSIVGDK